MTSTEQMAPTERAAPPAVATGARRAVKRAEAADALRIVRWIGAKLLYSIAPISVLFRLATWRGTLASLSSPRRAKVHAVVERHFRPAGGEADVRRLTRQFFQFRWRDRLVRRWPRIRRFTGVERIDVVGLEHLDAALAQGNGAVLVTVHFGYPALVKPVLRRHGYDARLAGKRRLPGERADAPKGGPTERADVPKAFTRLGAFVHKKLFTGRIWKREVGPDIPARMNLRPHFEALAANRALVVMADSGLALAGVTAAIFGIEVELSPGPFSIARATGAPVLPVFVVDTLDAAGPEAIRLRIHPPLDLQVTADEAADRRANVARFAAVYAQEATTYPHNWQWSWIRDGKFRSRRGDRW